MKKNTKISLAAGAAVVVGTGSFFGGVRVVDDINRENLVEAFNSGATKMNSLTGVDMAIVEEATRDGDIQVTAYRIWRVETDGTPRSLDADYTIGPVIIPKKAPVL